MGARECSQEGPFGGICADEMVCSDMPKKPEGRSDCGILRVWVKQYRQLRYVSFQNTEIRLTKQTIRANPPSAEHIERNQKATLIVVPPALVCNPRRNESMLTMNSYPNGSKKSSCTIRNLVKTQ